MGLLDDLKHKAEQLADKARGGLDRAGDLVGDVRERVGQHDGGDESDGEPEGDTETAVPGEGDEVGPDSSSTDAIQPGYVTGEDEDVLDADVVSEGDLDAEDASDDEAAALDPVATTETDAADPVDPAGPAEGTDAADEFAPDVETEVDPYTQPLSEPIGDVLDQADQEALAEVVDTSGDGAASDRDA